MPPTAKSTGARAVFASALLAIGVVALAGPPGNDACEDRVVLIDGQVAFSNVDASDDGPETLCGDGRSDIWFEFVSSVTGRAEMSVCDADFDTVLATYVGAWCPTHPVLRIGCNDDACEEQSMLEFEVIEGIRYLVQIGGRLGEEGSGTLIVTETDMCAADTDGDCEVNSDDLVNVILAWGTADSEADVNGDHVVNVVDLFRIIQSWGACPPCVGGVHSDAGECCKAQFTPGCEHAGCCTVVCDLDPSCCEIAWDPICAHHAMAVCQCEGGGQH